MNLPQTTYAYLAACQISVSKAWLEQRIKSHPDYPALVSLTDTLDELGLEHRAVQAREEHIPQFSFPFLAQTPRAVGGFEIVPSLQYYQTYREAFLNRWEGIAVMVTPAQKTTNRDHTVFFQREKRANAALKITVGLGIAIFLLAFLLHFHPLLFAFALLSMAGVSVSGMIILHKLGKGNAITRQLCSTVNSNGCNLVLHSRAAAWAKGTDLGDVGLVYFSTLLLFATFVSMGRNAAGAFSLLRVPGSLALAFTLFSLYYQWRVVKAWCRLCLLTVAIVWLQGIVIFAATAGAAPLLPSALLPLFAQLLLALSLATLWFWMKRMVQAGQVQRDTITSLLYWKRNPEIFLLLLRTQPCTSSFTAPNPTHIGSTGAPLQFTLVSSPFCRNCAAAYRQLEELYSACPGLVAISVVFLVGDTNDSGNRRTVAAAHILSAITEFGSAEEVLRHWFSSMSISDFADVYPGFAATAATDAILDRHRQWVHRNNIQHTPLVYLNGYPLPPQYTPEDLQSFVLELSELFTQQEETTTHEKVADLSWQ